MFPSGQRKGSAGEAGTKERCGCGQRRESAGKPAPGTPAARERSLAARSERSERPIAGHDAAAQADQAGKGETAVQPPRHASLGLATHLDHPVTSELTPDPACHLLIGETEPATARSHALSAMQMGT